MATEVDVAAKLAFFLLEETGSIFGTWQGTMPVAAQRARFGRVIWGRKRVRVDGGKETISYMRSVCFGLDFELIERTWAEADRGQDLTAC